MVLYSLNKELINRKTRKTKCRALHPEVNIQEKIQLNYDVRIQETWNWLKTETL